LAVKTYPEEKADDRFFPVVANPDSRLAKAFPGRLWGIDLERVRGTGRSTAKSSTFGYPARPHLEDQQGIWKLLKPEEIGVRLTEDMMMDPEASVSALVFHHPDCAYFTAAEAQS
jgi:Vitamin B12 dependent methionine synthase, activation domain